MTQPDYNLIPRRIKEAIDEWVRVGRPTGHFVRAVLENDLTEAIGRADDLNINALPHIVCYPWNCVSSLAWGSVAKVQAWELMKDAERAASETAKAEVTHGD